MRLCDCLNLPAGIIAVVGGGGKTTLIWHLAQELCQNATVLITTTTHIWPPDCPVLQNPTGAQVRDAFTRTTLIAVGDPTTEGKLGEPRCFMGNFAGLADYVLVEADGSRGLPLKAPAEYEPVIPAGAALTLAVAGMSCAGLTVEKAAHRSALYALRAGASEQSCVTPMMVAQRLCSPDGQRKSVTGAFLVVLNQTDTPQRLAFAREVAAHCDTDAVIVALKTKPDWAECHPVTLKNSMGRTD